MIGDTIAPKSIPNLNHSLFGTINTLGKKIPKKRKMNAMMNAQSLISWPCKTGYNPITTKTAEKWQINFRNFRK